MSYYEYQIPAPNPPTPRGRGDYDPPDYDRDDYSRRSYEDIERPWLEYSDYDYNPHDNEWDKLISTSRHTARVDHKDGKVKAGDRYVVYVWRVICDATGESRHSRVKHVVKRATEGG